MIALWTGSLYPATLHRVIHRAPTYRVSVPFFFEPNWDARVRLLAGAKRRAEEEGREVKGDVKEEGTVYGEFLLNKVGGNFVKY
jgi:isopenicillin N synthase-like dioxygenase